MYTYVDGPAIIIINNMMFYKLVFCCKCILFSESYIISEF